MPYWPTIPLPRDLPEAVLHTAAYADVFDYPLTAAEIHRYLIGVPASYCDVERFLQASALLPETGGFYTLPGREGLASVRRRRERLAARLWAQAVRYGRLIAGLPFVRMVAVTGALARSNVEAGADIDYLLVTEPGRLWLCRAMTLLVRRLARLQSVELCPNYLVSLRTLAFPDRTLYTAYELAQMAPLSGLDVYVLVRATNPWVRQFLPNAPGAPDLPAALSPPVVLSPARPALEALFRTAPFTRLERWEMERKIRRLRREQGGSPEAYFSADCCKGHNQGHQARTQAALAGRLSQMQRSGL